MLDREKLDMRLFHGLAAHDGFRRLAGVDHAGHDLDEPGMASGDERAGAELLDQHQAVEHGVVGQDGGGVAALEDFAQEGLAPAAVVLLVPQAVAVDLEAALVDGGLLDHLDVVARKRGIARVLRRRGHDFNAPVMNKRARPSTKRAISSGTLGSR